MRVKFIVEGGEPMHRFVDLPACPRLGEYVQVPDGVRRYAGAVVWPLELESHETGDLAYDVRIELRMGVPS